VANVVVSAIATFNGKALKKGQKDISAFDKQTQKLGKTFNRVFATTALVAFGKKAVNAFAADEKAAKSLAVQLQNTGNAFRVTEVETYIAGLQNLYKVLDDQLRPAFQTLLNATGSVTLSQQALETALNVSAGTGASLETIIGAIAAGVRGQTKAIKGLNTGIDANIIATGDMNKIMAALEKRFAGQALARLDTYAGKMDSLKIAAANATEIIGKGLIDALSALAKDNSIDEATDSMNQFALAIAETVKGLGLLVGEVKKFADSDVGKLLAALAFLAFGSKKLIIGGALALIGYDIGKSNPSSKPNVGGYSGIPDLRTSKALLKARGEEYKIITKKNAIENKNVEELKKKFDLERIGLTAALNAATDEETKLRLRSLLAILDNNDAMAKKLLAEIEATKSLQNLSSVTNLTIDYFNKLAQSLVGTANYLNMTFQQILDERLRESGNIGLSPIIPRTSSNFPSLPASYFENLGTRLEGNANYAGMTAAQISSERLRESGNRPVEVNLTVTAPSGDAFAQAIAQSLQVAGRSGYSTAPNGGLP